jgi:hypothetical protein
MKTFIKILAVSALLIALCQAVPLQTVEEKKAAEIAKGVAVKKVAAAKDLAVKMVKDALELAKKTKTTCDAAAVTKATATKAACKKTAEALAVTTKNACEKTPEAKNACATADATKTALAKVNKTKETCEKADQAKCDTTAADKLKAAEEKAKKLLAAEKLAANAKVACERTVETKAACVKADKDAKAKLGKEECDAEGMGLRSATPQCEVDHIGGKCRKGFHKVDKKCRPNTSLCSEEKYDPKTFNCTSCKWYAFHVQNDAQSKSGTKNGNYCETRWWWITLYIVLGLIGLLLVAALIYFLCCRSKKAKDQRKPLVNVNKSRGSSGHDSRVYRSNEMVEVHQARPVHYEHREVRHEPREVRHETREVRHVETSPRVHREVRHVETSPRHQSQVRTAYSPYKNHQD